MISDRKHGNMKEYLLLFRGGDASHLRPSAEKWQEHMDHWMTWMGDLTLQQKLVSAQPLDKTGRLISANGTVVRDEPYMAGNEMVGGYLLCRSENYAAAVAIAKGCPILEMDDGIVEVREIQDLAM